MEAMFDTIHKLIICTSGAVLTFGFILVFVLVKEIKGNRFPVK